MDNLIVVYDNAADGGTLTASSTAGSTSINNTKLNTKSKVWRSTSTTATILLTFTSRVIQAVALAFCNISTTGTIRVKGYTSNPTLSGVTIVGGTMAWDSGTMLACPWENLLHTSATSPVSGVSVYSYAGGKIGRCYYENSTPITSITIELVDTSNPAGYIEISRIIAGDFWSPQFNTSYAGVIVKRVELSGSERTDSGDLVSTVGTKHIELGFDLKYMLNSDRSTFNTIISSNGTVKPMFISLFPYATEIEKERDFQIFGKISSISPIMHPVYSIYSSQLNIEEI